MPCNGIYDGEKKVIRAIYSFMTNEKRIAFFRKLDGFLRKRGGHLYLKTLGQLKYILRFRSGGQRLNRKKTEEKEWEFCLKYEKAPEGVYRPLVSILAPDPAVSTDSRIRDMIYRQSYDNVEVLTAENRKPPESRLDCAKGGLIWIIEEGVICGPDFLEKTVPLFRYRSVMTGFGGLADSGGESQEFRGGGSERYITAFDLLGQIEEKNLSVPPLGAVLFRRGADLNFVLKAEEPDPDIPGEGRIARQGENRTLSLLKRGGVAGCTKELLYQSKSSGDEVGIQQYTSQVIMACYALKSGGGEIFPIHLANALKKSGTAVTLLNFGLEPEEKGIAELLDDSIPLVNLRHTDDIAPVLCHLGGGIVHTHQAVTDYAVSMFVKSHPGICRQIITLHGMYETIAREDCERVIRAVLPVCSGYAYVADKNLGCFRSRGIDTKEKFVKIPPGIPKKDSSEKKAAEENTSEEMNAGADRSRLGIGREDFVFILASRGIPEKGWREAVQALERLRTCCRRKLHLVILGDGECRSELERNAPENVHFLGAVGNVREYFAMGDAGLLPTMYPGESFPLVIMECLMCGKPMIATDIGEIRNQIQDEEGHKAGMLLSLVQGRIDTEELAECMCMMAEHPDVYRRLRRNAEIVSEKFDIEKTTKEYLQLYRRAGL